MSRGPAQQPSSKDVTLHTKVVVYFHGNAEDVGSSYDFILKMSLTF